MHQVFLGTTKTTPSENLKHDVGLWGGERMSFTGLDGGETDKF
jgi:hypothetical protein